jgi:hypothetical protein
MRYLDRSFKRKVTGHTYVTEGDNMTALYKKRSDAIATLNAAIRRRNENKERRLRVIVLEGNSMGKTKMR